MKPSQINYLREIYDRNYFTYKKWKYDIVWDARKNDFVRQKVSFVETVHFDPLTTSYRSLFDFFCNGEKRFFIGQKGTGKTFNTLLAINAALAYQGILHQQIIKPCYISFDITTQKTYIKKPLSYITKNLWNNRPVDFDSFDEAIDWCNCIIFDEIHYLLEYIIRKNLDVSPLITLIEKLWAKKARTLFISEVPLFSYAEKIKDCRFDTCLKKMGLYPRVFGEDGFCSIADIEPLVLKEIHTLNFEQLQYLVNIYKLDISVNALFLLSLLPITNRGIIKLMKQFKSCISLQELEKLACDAGWDNSVFDLRSIHSEFESLNFGRNDRLSFCSPHFKSYVQELSMFISHILMPEKYVNLLFYGDNCND